MLPRVAARGEGTVSLKFSPEHLHALLACSPCMLSLACSPSGLEECGRAAITHVYTPKTPFPFVRHWLDMRHGSGLGKVQDNRRVMSNETGDYLAASLCLSKSRR